jgi:hypothetical protein
VRGNNPAGIFSATKTQYRAFWGEINRESLGERETEGRPDGDERGRGLWKKAEGEAKKC